MRPHVEALARIAPTYVSCHPNAGLPNAFGGYDEQPPDTSRLLGEFARDGLVNVVGGCCGTTPEHTKAIADTVRCLAPRRVPKRQARTRLSGLEPFEITEDTGFVMIGERTNVTGSTRFRGADRGRRLPGRGRDRARAGARRREPARREHGRRPARLGAGDDDLPQPDRDRAGGRAAADHGRQLALVGDRGRAPLRPGQGHRQLDQPQGGGGGLPRACAHGARLRRGDRRDGLRRGGAGGHRRAQGGDLRARLPAARRGRLPARGHDLRPERARGRDGDRGAQRVREGVHRGAAADQGALPRREDQRRHLQPLVLVPRQRRRARGDALGLPLPRDPGGPRHGHRQRRPADGLRGHPAGAARARRGRPPQPPPRRDGAAGRVRGPRRGPGDEARARPLLARGPGRGAALARARPRHRRLHRGGRRGGAAGAAAAAGRDRGPADGGDEGRRRPLRVRPDVPAAGRQERAGDEARRRLSGAVHGGRAGRRRPGAGRRSCSPR